jgi:hypothetical protein
VKLELKAGIDLAPSDYRSTLYLFLLKNSPVDRHEPLFNAGPSNIQRLSVSGDASYRSRIRKIRSSIFR